jgi:TonB family protein
MSNTTPSGSNQSDLLLWIAGGAIAVMGAAWLFITQPWADSGTADAALVREPAGAPREAAEPVEIAMASPGDTAAPTTPPDEADAALDNPLRMAELAYDAGMLVEPEEYSAWTLYSRVLRTDPDSAAAREGLSKVADDLIKRGETALEQGRFDDARATVERIRSQLPDHPGAKALGAKIWPEAKPVIPTATLPEPERPRVERVAEAPPAAPARPQVDPIKQASDAFEKAMAASQLLTPVEQSAKHYLSVMREADGEHELTRRASSALSQEFLSRAAQSVEALDPEAAGIWIDEAEAILGASDWTIRAARSALNEQLIAMESARPVPASALKVTTYVAPVYPPRANERNLEGWVDIEFTVGTDGRTHDVVVTDASHDTFFRREAVEAVEKWTFEPRVYLGRTIEQTSFTRIKFVN